MKKLLSLITQTILISGFEFSISACHNPFIDHRDDNNNPEITPVPIPTKDIKYYETLIKEKEKEVATSKQAIKEIQDQWDKNEDENISDEAFKALIALISIDLYTNQEQINEYQYQILLLNKIDDKFTSSQIDQGINIFTEKIKNLQELLKIKTKYPEDYSEATLKKIKTKIKEATKIKEYFENLKAEGEK